MCSRDTLEGVERGVCVLPVSVPEEGIPFG